MVSGRINNQSFNLLCYCYCYCSATATASASALLLLCYYYATTLLLLCSCSAPAITRLLLFSCSASALLLLLLGYYSAPALLCLRVASARPEIQRYPCFDTRRRQSPAATRPRRLVLGTLDLSQRENEVEEIALGETLRHDI